MELVSSEDDRRLKYCHGHAIMTKRRWNTWVSWLLDHAGFHCGDGRLAVMIDVISGYRPPLPAHSLSDFGTDQPTPSVDPLLGRSETNAGSHPSLSSVCLLRTRHDDPTVLSFPWCSISYLADLTAPRRLKKWSFKALSLGGARFRDFARTPTCAANKLNACLTRR